VSYNSAGKRVKAISPSSELRTVLTDRLSEVYPYWEEVGSYQPISFEGNFVNIIRGI